MMVYRSRTLDMKEPNPVDEITIPEDGMILEPEKLYLGRTVEYTETDNLVPMLEGRSSIGRLGLFVHVTAGFGDVGFKGYWTLEIFCVQPVRIYPDIEVCQVYFHSIEGEYTTYEQGKYQKNNGIQPSLLYKDFEK
jgi:dCTP deaminase